VTAEERTLLMCVSQRNFGRLLRLNAQIEATLTGEAKRRLLASFRNLRVPLFADLSDTRLQKLADAASLVPAEPRARIACEEGDDAGLYIVADGVVHASVRARPATGLVGMLSPPKPPGAAWRLGHGAYFGELGLIDEARRAELQLEHVAGAEPVTMLRVPAAAFADIFGKDRTLLAELRLKVHGAAVSLRTILAHSRARTLLIQHVRSTRGTGNREQLLYFYEAVVQYEQLEPLGFVAAARSVAQGIIDEYVLPGSANHVALPADLARGITQALHEGRFERFASFLASARQEVYRELERTCLAPFTSSELFTTLLAALAAGNDLSALRRELADIEA
jgi:CRP-like cAMP-binding protein